MFKEGLFMKHQKGAIPVALNTSHPARAGGGEAELCLIQVLPLGLRFWVLPWVPEGLRPQV